MTTRNDELTPKQARFVSEYLIDLNATQAYIRAGYKYTSLQVANSNSIALLTNHKVQSAIQEAQKARESRTLVTQDRVIQELARLGFSDMRDYVEWGPNGVKLKPSSELTEAQARAVIEVSETITKDGGTIRFKLANKQDALHDLGQHLGMFPRDTHDINVIVPIQVNISEASKRAI